MKALKRSRFVLGGLLLLTLLFGFSLTVYAAQISYTGAKLPWSGAHVSLGTATKAYHTSSRPYNNLTSISGDSQMRFWIDGDRGQASDAKTCARGTTYATWVYYQPAPGVRCTARASRLGIANDVYVSGKVEIR
jgi:hypothetical protein